MILLIRALRNLERRKPCNPVIVHYVKLVAKRKGIGIHLML